MGLKNHCYTDCREQCVVVKMEGILVDVVRDIKMNGVQKGLAFTAGNYRQF